MGSVGLYQYVRPSFWRPHMLAGGPQHTVPGNRGMQTIRAIWQCKGNCADSHPHPMASKDAANKGTEGAGGCCKTERGTPQSACLALDWWGLHHYNWDWGKAHTDARDICTKVGSKSSQRSIGGMHAAGPGNRRTVCYGPPGSTGPVGGALHQDHHTIRVTQDESRWLCWGPVRHGIPPWHVLWLKAWVLVKGFIRLCELRVQSMK